MRLTLFILSVLLGATMAHSAESADTLPRAVVLAGVDVTRIKTGLQLGDAPVAATIIGERQAERLGIIGLKQVGDVTPNVYIPDYGSRMTSSIYVRGIGARIDRPVVGLTVDNIPILNKDNYDFDLPDIEHIDVLRGPQSTLYGRNTMCGMVSITTLSPLRFRGLRAGLTLGTGGVVRASVLGGLKLSPTVGMSLSGQFNRTGGFVTNRFNGRKADAEEGGSLRWKTAWQPRETLVLENTASMSIARQHGYPYEWEQTREVNYNDTCLYDRTSLMDGLTLTWHTPAGVTLSSVTSLQYLDDRMTLDQDFLPEPWFTLTQDRREWTLTQDFVLKGSRGIYSWMAGAFAFSQRWRMDAPVTFKDTGIERLIEEHANSNNPSYPIRWDERTFPLLSSFHGNSWGAAAYHRSSLRLNRWTIDLDLRIDYERTALDYASACSAPYTILDLTGPTPGVYDHRRITIDRQGTLSQDGTQLLPRLALTYALPRLDGSIIYASVAKGYKPGGFNVQMFSDVLQQLVMEELGVTARYDVEDIVSYRPETSWNYELGAKLTLPRAALDIEAALFYISVTDQQITLFPDGLTTGRIMANAGSTRSLGAELSLRWRPAKQWTLSAAWGLTDARFQRFDNGRESFDGNHVPYAPANTLFFSALWRLPLDHPSLRAISIQTYARGIGRIWWDEANTRSQPFYILPAATVTLEANRWSIMLRGENLTNTRYDTFSYTSISNVFYQRGKPIRCDLTLRLQLP